MCLAIPYGKDEQNHESPLWHRIRTTPLFLMGLGSILLLLSLGIFWLSLISGILKTQHLSASAQLISAYLLVSGVGGFWFFALSMHFYPRLMRSSPIEYLYYGGYFFLSMYNLVFFYLAVFAPGSSLLISSMLIQLLLMLFAFRPLWWAFYWSNTRHRKWGYFVNTVFIALLGTQLGFIFAW